MLFQELSQFVPSLLLISLALVQACLKVYFLMRSRYVKRFLLISCQDHNYHNRHHDMLLNVNRQPEALFELYSDSPISVPPPPIVNVITLLVINMFHDIYP